MPQYGYKPRGGSRTSACGAWQRAKKRATKTHTPFHITSSFFCTHLFSLSSVKDINMLKSSGEHSSKATSAWATAPLLSANLHIKICRVSSPVCSDHWEWSFSLCVCVCVGLCVHQQRLLWILFCQKQPGSLQYCFLVSSAQTQITARSTIFSFFFFFFYTWI